jgi:hypothetical protein
MVVFLMIPKTCNNVCTYYARDKSLHHEWILIFICFAFISNIDVFVVVVVVDDDDDEGCFCLGINSPPPTISHCSSFFL